MNASEPTFAGFSSAALAVGSVALPAARRFTVDEYHRMIDSSILTENDRVELIDGWVIEMPPIGPEHSTANSLTGQAIEALLPAGWIVRYQDPITLAASEPEPDVVVARGTVRDYARRHPAAADIALVVEISDATLALDRNQKAAQYAAGGIPEYWIVNLIDRQIEVFSGPQSTGAALHYRRRELLAASRTVTLTVNGQALGLLKVTDLLP